MRPYATVSLALLAVGVAACQSGGYTNRPPVAARPSGAEGQWVDANGIATSTLASGVFESVANDTGQKISDGAYTYRDPRTIDLTINSLIRGTTSSATCLLVTANQLNCTNSEGVQFVLVRKQGTV